MKTTFHPVRSRRSMQGLSLVELMIAMTLGLIVLAALVSVFANSSASRAELERTSRQIENGRFAMELLSDDIRHAGFYGEANLLPIPITAMSDPCNTDPAHWAAVMPIHVHGYYQGASLPPCFAGSIKPKTDAIVIRRTSTCEAGVGTCPAALPLEAYFQVSKCADETATKPYMIGTLGGSGAAAFDLHAKNCIDKTEVRRYYMRMYYIALDNGNGVNVPTLTRMEYAGVTPVYTPLVEGVEEMNFEYGLDTDLDGNADVYKTVPAGQDEWAQVVSVRISILARNLEESPGYTDAKKYVLGRDATGTEIVVQPNDHYRRHAYSALVRVVNASERRETP
jgi:type IV pilus assembly protein PilW